MAGSVYEPGTVSVLHDGGNNALRVNIRPAAWVELVNLLDPPQLARAGLDIGQLSEKWKAIDLVSALDPEKPDDHFLLIGNDFIVRQCVMRGQPCDSDTDNDNRIFVCRVTLPLARLPGSPADEDHLASGCVPAMNRMASATASGFSLWMLCPVARYSCMPRV